MVSRPLLLPPPTERLARAGAGLEGPLPERQVLRLVDSLPCPQISPVGNRLAGREMGLGEGVGWQREGTEGPQLVTLCLSAKIVHIHTGLAGGGWRRGMPLPGGEGAVTYGEVGTCPDNAPSGPTQNNVGLPGEGGPVLIRMGWNDFEVIYTCLLLSPPPPVSFLVGVAEHIWKARFPAHPTPPRAGGV